MSVLPSLLDAAGTVALLLWGVRMVQTGLQRTLGPWLHRILAAALRTRLHAAMAGMGLTAALQSSTATGLMVSRFVADGAVSPVSALAAVLGGGVGTALVVQALSFDLSHAAWIILLLGTVLFRRRDAPALRDLGRTLVGLGLMLLALHGLVGLAVPLAQTGAAQALLLRGAAHPALVLVAAGLLAWAAHSSVAVVLLTMPLASQGVLSPPAALAAVLGANLSTAFSLYFEGARSPASRRLGLGNLLMRAAGCLAVLPLLDQAAHAFLRLDPDPARLVANAHTVFNLLLLIAFLPLLGPLSRLLLPIGRDTPVKDAGMPLHLNAANLILPALAIEGAEREALRMAGVLEDMLCMFPAIIRGDRQAMAEARHARTALEHLGVAVRDYLAAVDPDALTETARARIREVFTFVTNIGRAGSALEGGLFRRVARAIRSGDAFTPAVFDRLRGLMEQLQDNLAAASSVFSNRDLSLARLLAAEKQVFRDYEAEALLTSLPFLRHDAFDKDKASIPIEVLGEFRSVNGHLVASSANALLEAEGELLSSRVVKGASAKPLPAVDGTVT